MACYREQNLLHSEEESGISQLSMVKHDNYQISSLYQMGTFKNFFFPEKKLL